MKLEKISLIESPHPEVTLGIGEMDNVLGGVTCESYTLCNNEKDSSCTSFDNSKNGQCGDDKDLTHVLCTSHRTTCVSNDAPMTCSTYSF